MTRKLKTGRRGPAAGEATSLVVFLHGYGADGADLLGLAEPLGQHLPGTAFLAPDAPEPCRVNPAGRQWFPIPWLDGASDDERQASFAASRDDLHAFLDTAMAEEGLAADRVVLFGFSQGTMMSLEVGLRRPAAPAGIVGFSGMLLQPGRLTEVTSKPAICLLHGDRDDVVPYTSLAEATDALKKAGLDVYAHTMEGTPHGIAPDGLSVALAFIRDRLARAA